MNLTIGAKDFKLTPSLKEYVTDKLSKLQKFHPRITKIGVELDVDHNVTKGRKFRVEVWIDWAGGGIEAGSKGESMQEALDLVYPKLERQLVKAKEKHPRHRSA